MKIGIFTDCYEPIISGVSVSLRTLKDELEKLGHEIIIITNDHENAKEDPSVLHLGGVRLPMKGTKEYRIGKVNRKKLQAVENLNLDMIHCHTEFTMGRLGRKFARKHNIPFVHTYHTMYEDYVHHITPAFKFVLRYASKVYSRRFADSANDVIFPTVKVKRKFDEYGYKGSSHIVPTGIYLERFNKKDYPANEIAEKKKELGIAKDDFVLLFLGRMSREKSVKELITQIAQNCISHKHIRLLLVGGGPDLEYFKHLVKKHHYEDRVTCTGMVSPHDVGLYYQLADLFVNFSVTETQGLTYYEALASGLPLLVKYDDNLEGVVINDVNGFSFTNDDDFCPLLDRMITDEELYNRIKSNTVSSVEKYSAQNYAKTVEKIYLNLLNKE